MPRPGDGRQTPPVAGPPGLSEAYQSGRIGKQGGINYYMTQFIIGHGYFNDRMEEVEDVAFLFRDSTKDSVYCTFFECYRWNLEREAQPLEIGPFTLENIIGIMLQDSYLYGNGTKNKKARELLEQRSH
ncbi:hypothetical protein Trydic_g11592 [Trypoxylus dichotomus]